jgi:DNA-binding SARP family transcriptional activator/TolB-like protein
LRLRTFGGLWIENPGADAGPGPRPRPLALLAILAVAGPKGTTRDRVVGVLWPETEEERARQSLSQAIYSLRRDLGVDVAISASGLRLDPRQMSSDVGEFRDAVGAKRWADAAALYHGPFLDGFYLADAAEFERWVETERASLATEGVRAIEAVAKTSADAGRLEEAAEHWHRLTRIDPANSRLAASFMEALATLGDRAGAFAHGRAQRDLLRREFEAEPDRAFERLMTRLRESNVTGEHVTKVGPGNLLPAPGSSTPPASDAPRPDAEAQPPRAETPSTPRRAPLRRRTALVLAVVVATVVLAILGWRSGSASRPAERPILAVGRIRDLVASDTAALGAVLSEMLATSLSRLGELQVIATSRMLELTPRDAAPSSVVLSDAARRAGATEIIEGELIPQPDRTLRLEVRRVDIAQGLVRRGYRVSGTDRTALFDSVTSLIAADLRLGAPSGSLADVSTRSPIAYRFYEEGLRALYQFDAYAAYRLFQQAIKEDSSFAMATYHAWRAARAIGDKDEERLAKRAFALASRASTRDRLLITAHVGGEHSEIPALAAAESLAALYPRDPEALVHAAGVLADLAPAVDLLNRAIALDSAAGPGSSPLCRLCEALSLLTTRYQWVDSVAAVDRTLARWRALRPNDATPWARQADWYTGLGRPADVETAERRFEALGGRAQHSYLVHLIQNLRFDDVDAANKDCAAGLAGSDSTVFLQYRWFCVIGLRMQGRYREARALLREGRIPGSSIVRPGMPPDVYSNALVDMEMGNGRVAADEFRAIGRAYGDSALGAGGIWARYHTWTLTLSATAAVAGGDTLRARYLVDTIQHVGQRSLFARDPRLHHFVRGLLLSRAKQHAAAVPEFRAALYSPTFGYTRINIELGESLLALGRPSEAIPLIQAGLHGGLEGSGLYVSRTDFHELLARLFAANQQPDSAAAHYAVVEHAWRSADPILRPRYEAAKQWLARAGQRRPGS